MKNRLCDIETRALCLGYRVGRVQSNSLWVEKPGAGVLEAAWFLSKEIGDPARCIDTGAFSDDEIRAIFTAWVGAVDV